MHVYLLICYSDKTQFLLCAGIYHMRERSVKLLGYLLANARMLFKNIYTTKKELSNATCLLLYYYGTISISEYILSHCDLVSNTMTPFLL